MGRGARFAVFASGLVLTALFATGADEVDELAYRVAGLTKPAEILVDRWGVPHIYAGDHYDAFFVQGFNAARDRLWQIDLWRRRGLGQLAEVLGPEYVERDRAARLFLYRGDMYREWLAYGSDAKRIASAFTAGINAYVDLTRERPELRPPEFDLLGYRPARWQPGDVVRIRSHGLWRNVESEVRRARLYCMGDVAGPAADGARRVLEPAWTPQVPDGLDPCQIPPGVLDVYRLAKAPVVFDPAARSGLVQHETTLDVGSNNWAIAPEKTATGRPILADDPHRGHAVPSLRYIAHLVAPGLDVIGAGEPALPGISIGHNERIAFGLTIFSIDQEDLYVYETRPATGGPGEYRYRDHWVPFERVEETVAVRGAEPRPVTLEFTRHGPVVYADPERRLAFAVRTAALEPGAAPYFGSVEYMRATSWREFRAALNRWGAPAENQVYADVDGNIGYKPAGLFPWRTSFDGLLPVPGDGRYEWQGFFDMDVLPEEYNPERGFVATANANNLPPDFPIDAYRVGFEWTPPWRHRRVFEVLGRDAPHDVEASLRLQRDFTSVLARDLIPALPEVDEPDAVRARALLVGWDARLGPDSAAAALWGVWFFRHLTPELTRARFPPEAFALVHPMDSRYVIELLREPDTTTTEVVERTLAAAWVETRDLLGSDPSGWRWGDLHRSHFVHPLLGRARGELARQMKLPEFGKGGSGYTTNNTWFRPNDFRVRGGASWRMVLDVGRWDAGFMTSAPGQSGDPRSRFYGSLLESWAREDQIPLIYSRAAVERYATLRVRLEPAAQPGMAR